MVYYSITTDSSNLEQFLFKFAPSSSRMFSKKSRNFEFILSNFLSILAYFLLNILRILKNLRRKKPHKSVFWVTETVVDWLIFQEEHEGTANQMCLKAGNSKILKLVYSGCLNSLIWLWLVLTFQVLFNQSFNKTSIMIRVCRIKIDLKFFGGGKKNE